MFDFISFIPRAVVQGIPLLFGSTGETLSEKAFSLKQISKFSKTPKIIICFFVIRPKSMQFRAFLLFFEGEFLACEKIKRF